jgi:hypothetical protein
MTVVNSVLGSEVIEKRKDSENRLFAEWKVATEPIEKERIERELQELLVNHAKTVMFTVLRRNESFLPEEAASRVIMNLGKFRDESLFTTWAHQIILRVVYLQRRQERQRKETSMTEILGFDVPGNATTEMTDMLLTIKKLLSEPNYNIFEHLVLLGESHAEASASLKIPKANLTRQWERIARTLQYAFSK